MFSCCLDRSSVMKQCNVNFNSSDSVQQYNSQVTDTILLLSICNNALTVICPKLMRDMKPFWENDLLPIFFLLYYIPTIAISKNKSKKNSCWKNKSAGNLIPALSCSMRHIVITGMGGGLLKCNFLRCMEAICTRY